VSSTSGLQIKLAASFQLAVNSVIKAASFDEEFPAGWKIAATGRARKFRLPLVLPA
jgi:hypothetical protein